MYREPELPAEPPLLPEEIRTQLNDQQWIKLSSEQGWHNMFYKEVLILINPDLFSVLYADGIGRPNAPIRLLVGMLLLKEGKNWSYEELESNCLFNIQVRTALGLSFNSVVPSESTYYDFKKALSDYKELHNRDLLEECQQDITSKQCKRYNCKGEKGRMDSKLINSNISKQTRLQLILSFILCFYNTLTETLKSKLPNSYQTYLNLVKEKGINSYTHSLTKSEQKQQLIKLGGLLWYLLKTYQEIDSPVYSLLVRLQEEQYEYVDATPEDATPEDATPEDATPEDATPEDATPESIPKIQPKKKGEIKGTTLQSIRDTDAEYRKKISGQKIQKVRGYSINLFELIEADAPNLITVPQTEGAATADNTFFQPAIEKSEQITDKAIKEAWTDGAYHDPDNLEFCQQREQPIQWHIPKIQGKEGNFDFQWTKQQTLQVTNRTTQETQIAYQTKSGTYRICIYDPTTNKKNYRYFSKKDIENYERRQQIKQEPPEVLNIRASVESTVYQVMHTLNGNKCKYVGLTRCHWFVCCRVMWVNFKRICAFNAKKVAIQLFRTIYIPQMPYNLFFFSSNKKDSFTETSLNRFLFAI